MHSHRTDTALVSKNVRLEIIYESNPCFASESLSVVVRLRHLGSLQELSNLEAKLQELEQRKAEREKAKEQDGKPWLVKSFLETFSKNKLQEEHDKQLESAIEEKLSFHKAVDLMSCYVQLFGCFEFDPEIIDSESLNKISKVAGIGSQSFSDLNKPISESITDFLNTNFDDITKAATSEGNVSPLSKIPLLLTSQTLLFSELVLEPGELKTYHFKSPKLPIDLPPSYYSSKSLSINYFFHFGITKVESVIKSFKAKFPLHVASFINPQGYQYVAPLDRETIILGQGHVKEVHESSKRRRSTTTLSSRRRSSLLTLPDIQQASTKDETPQKIKEMFNTLVSQLDSKENSTDIEDLVEQLMDFQFGANRYASSDDEDEEETKNKDAKSSVRDNISNLYNNVINNLPNKVSTDETFLLQPQLKNLQKEYIINRNGEFICKVLLSKLLYKTSDEIDLVIEFQKDSKHKVSAVSATLESFELVNPKYSKDQSDSKVKPQGISAYETHSICFDNCSSIPLKLTPQRTPTNQITAQFRTNVFQFKWMLTFKFVLLENNQEGKSILEKFYNDKNGSLYHAKEQLEGEEFSCHIPVIILPTEKEFGGW